VSTVSVGNDERVSIAHEGDSGELVRIETQAFAKAKSPSLL
jgi:hypothetical protein